MGNPLQQLDLFGMPVETSPASKPKKQVVKKVVETAPVTKNVPVEIIEPETFTETVIEEPVVYASKQIVVKVKSAKTKTNPTVVSVESISSPKIKGAGKRGRKSFKEMDAVVDLIEIPTDEILKQKLYYSISEVASWFKVNTSLLRYWENEFDILQPRKTRKGDRLFRVEDIKNLQLIYLLLRQRKFSIEGAKSYLKNNKNKIDTETQLVQSLTKFRQFLLELKSSLSN